MKPVFLTAIIGLVLLVNRTCAQSNTADYPLESRKTVKMKEFSLLIRVPLNYTTEQAIAVGPKWNELLDRWKADSVYIISFPFPAEGYIVSGPEKLVKKGSVISDNLRVVSNLFIRADSIEKAIELSKSCPILEFGGSVEVRESPQISLRTDDKN